PSTAGVYVGTEAVLHRVERADVVAFLDFDRELLAPRYRAAEQAMTLLVRAARLVGRRETGARILVQTFVPDHPVLRAALIPDPGRLADTERAARARFRLPPFGAYAEISGAGAAEYVDSVPRTGGVQVAADGVDGWLARAADWTALGTALTA